MWTPVSDQNGRRGVVYVTERARRRAAGAVIVLVVVTVVSALLAATATVVGWTAALAGACGAMAAVYQRGGRAGFYEIDHNGSLGQFLGRPKPDLSSLRRTRPRHPRNR
jgi:hypothetical protein